MNSSVERLLAVVIVLLLGGGIATLSDRKSHPKTSARPTPTTTARLSTVAPYGCLPLPKTTSYPSWYPKDLPLPTGSYPARVSLPKVKGFPRGVFVVKGTLREFIVHALGVWPKKGWQLGLGESEAGEAEDVFFRLGTQIRGAFVARSSYCDTRYTWLYIVMGSGQAPRPTPTSTATPTSSPTPLSP